MSYSFNREKHIHTLNDKPLLGTSTVMDVLAKPLTWWASGKAVETLGWIKAGDWKKLKSEEEKNSDIMRRLAHVRPYFEKIKNLPNATAYLALLDKAYRAHADNLKVTAKDGTNLHAEAEAWVKGNIKEAHIPPHEKIEPFVRWARDNVKRYLWSEAHCYSERLWVGGISDCGVELTNGEYAIVDFKSSKEAYLSQAFQVAGYDIQVTENGIFSESGKHSMKLDKLITKHIIVPFGAENCVPVIFPNVDQNKKAFEACVELHKILNINN